MSIFGERERAAEQRFEHEQELAFKSVARRNRLLGLWAAGRLGLRGRKAEAYARELVGAEVGVPGDREILERIRADSIVAGMPIPADEIGRHLDLFAVQACGEIMRDEKKGGTE
jgi:hypothetical protein